MSAVGFGTRNIGGSWGGVSDETGRDVVRATLESEIDFIDTAAVVDDGRSERDVLAARPTAVWSTRR
ncbi:aldo/keto reductase [Natrinema sp. DC36]|uniref:aldo/keto reductase n=1 Tax=Natrinema sp. DC36 TaxID=2878680 RepID=UPI001CF06102|nr:aldo/keto reductase [Natrinema sp. DC36]